MHSYYILFNFWLYVTLLFLLHSYTDFVFCVVSTYNEITVMQGGPVIVQECLHKVIFKCSFVYLSSD